MIHTQNNKISEKSIASTTENDSFRYIIWQKTYACKLLILLGLWAFCRTEKRSISNYYSRWNLVIRQLFLRATVCKLCQTTVETVNIFRTVRSESWFQWVNWCRAFVGGYWGCRLTIQTVRVSNPPDNQGRFDFFRFQIIPSDERGDGSGPRSNPTLKLFLVADELNF